MTAPYLGGFRIVACGWISAHALAVQIESSYGDSYLYQLYAGRTLVGVSAHPSQRVIVGSVDPSDWPEHITVLAIEPAQRFTDYGADLPLRPYNRVRLRFSTASWPTDSKSIELAAGTEVDGAVDPDNILVRTAYDGDHDYEIFSPPMPGSGQWNFEIAGRDNRPDEGNRGTALAVSKTVLAHPPDVVLQDDNSRFSVAIAAGTATITFENP